MSRFYWNLRTLFFLHISLSIAWHFSSLAFKVLHIFLLIPAELSPVEFAKYMWAVWSVQIFTQTFKMYNKRSVVGNRKIINENFLFWKENVSTKCINVLLAFTPISKRKASVCYKSCLYSQVWYVNSVSGLFLCIRKTSEDWASQTGCDRPSVVHISWRSKVKAITHFIYLVILVLLSVCSNLSARLFAVFPLFQMNIFANHQRFKIALFCFRLDCKNPNIFYK